ncbi:MAG: hypothetical protein RLZZ111_35 [Planctomycetota bacterium]
MPDRRPPSAVRSPALRVAACCLLLTAGAGAVPTAAREPQPGPVSYGGRYPHLAVSNAQGECGIGAVVPWADRLWFITYGPHLPNGSDDKLYELDASLHLTPRPESVGGTPAARLIHRESNQLVIGPYLIGADRTVRAVSPRRMPGRLTAAARHLTDPAGKVYVADMEGLVYELDVRSAEPQRLFARPAPGWHAKGGYSGQGVLVLANNGEHAAGTADAFKPFLYAIPNTRNAPAEAGVLAEWDGKDWRLIRRRQFTDVTGPGGIAGPPSAEAPLWAIGWDEKSVLLMVRSFADAQAGKNPWHAFRLPKACGSYDGDHGWHTEWPRIREVVPAADGEPARFILTMHGGWYELPAGFSATSPCGLEPLCTHLKITGDVAPWRVDGRQVIVFGCDDAARSGFKSELQNPRNDLTGRSNSNLWFTTWESLRAQGRPAGTAYAWRDEDVTAGRPSDPVLFSGGYHGRCVHLAHRGDSGVAFTLEAGCGETWREVAVQTVPAQGYAHVELPDDVPGDWIRVVADRDVRGATCVFRYGTRGGQVRDDELFAPLADALAQEPWIAAVMRSGSAASLPLDALAWEIDPARAEPQRPTAWQTLLDAPPRRLAADDPLATLLAEQAVPASPDVTFDAASVIYREGKRVFRLPKPLDPAVARQYERPFASGWPRGLREVVTERSLLNAAGTFYVVPRATSGGAAKMQPVCSHGKRITDFCSWRGLLVLGGVRCDGVSGPGGSRVFASGDPAAVATTGPAVWVGDIDELWKFPPPTGRGGPWHETAVSAGAVSDPYLMGGYGEKCLEIAHDAATAVPVSIQVDPTGDGAWFEYATLDVASGAPAMHTFPDGFAAQWVRLRAAAPCRITATFTYR